MYFVQVIEHYSRILEHFSDCEEMDLINLLSFLVIKADFGNFTCWQWHALLFLSSKTFFEYLFS